MINLTDALQRWSELEPIRCNRKLGATFVVTCQDEFFWIYENAEPPLPWLEYAVREAIEARGLFWQVNQMSKGKFAGYIYRFGFRHGATSEAWIPISERDSSSSAAHALLLTYIAYLEFQVES